MKATPRIEALDSRESLTAAGFRFGEKGTHTSRTIMLAELTDLLRTIPQRAESDAYLQAVVEENALGKQTIATRRLTYQRLRELYALDPRVPLFRVLRRLWAADQPGRPLVAMLCALARDPLLCATMSAVIPLPPGAELVRALLLDALRHAVRARLNEAVLEKVARNVGSSWCQSGHLAGRVRKLRRRVTPTPGSVAMVLWMGTLEGLAGRALLESRWAGVLDRTGDALLPVALQAKQLGLVHVRAGGHVVEIDASRLDAAARG